MKTVTFDLETTGVDTENDRILTCFMRAKDGNKVVFEQNWVIDPGVEVPAGGAEVHGMTTEWVQEHGRKDVAEAIKEICDEVYLLAEQGYIIAGYNHSFDLSMLESECVRYGVTPLGKDYLFVDPLVIDRHVDKYRKGGRKLMEVAKHYGIKVDESRLHEAEYDVLVTEQLVSKVMNLAWRKEKHGLNDPQEFIHWLQDKQKEWRAEWVVGIKKYFAKQGKTFDGSEAFPW